MSLFGVSEVCGVSVAVGGSWEPGAQAAGSESFMAGYVFDLSKAPASLALSTPAPLTAIDHATVVGWQATILEWVGGVWKQGGTLGTIIPPSAALTSVVRSYDGVTGDLATRTLVGYDGLTEQGGGIIECFGLESCYPFDGSSPAGVVRLGAATTVEPVDTMFLFDTTARFALTDGPNGAVIWTEALDLGWTNEPPWGCWASDASAPCGGVKQWRDLVGVFTDETWAVGTGGVAPVLLRYQGQTWQRVPVDIPASVGPVDIEALATSGGHLFAAGEAVGCGEAACAGDPSWRSHVLLHRDPGGTWSPLVVLDARQCTNPVDPAGCEGELDLFRVRDMVWTANGELVIVGSTIDTSVVPVAQQLLTYQGPAGAPAPSIVVCGNGACDATEACDSCPIDCGPCADTPCMGFCGGLSPLGCWCDQTCAASGDCCIDSCPSCGVNCPQ